MHSSIEKDTQTMGQNIAIKRMDAGYSQERFSEMIGISKTALGKIERGESAPRSDTVISVCRELHAEPNAIFPAYLSGNTGLDPEMAEMAAAVNTLSPAQKKQFYAMMKVVFSGIKNPEY